MSNQRSYNADNRMLNDPPISTAESASSASSSSTTTTNATNYAATNQNGGIRYSVSQMPQPVGIGEEEYKRTWGKKFVRWLKYGPVD